MSTISDKLRYESPRFLVALDFDGLVKRYADRDVNVPYSAGDPVLFKGLIKNDLNIAARFNFTQFRLSDVQVSVTIANTERLQDEETRRRLDGGTGTIYIWCEGLDWADIETAGIIFKGTFVKARHTRSDYVFTLGDSMRTKMHRLPVATINSDTWPSHRTIDGGGSVAGKPQPMVFGDWTAGVPLLCVDTATPKYIAATGTVKSVEADYTAGTVDVYDKTGAVVNVANYVLEKTADGIGNPAVVFNFNGAGAQTANEPLSCSIKGHDDGSGEITGTAGTLLEHPADFFYYVLLNYSDYTPAEIDVESLKTMRSILPGLKFASLITSEIGGAEFVDRIMTQCHCARMLRPGGKPGVMVFDTTQPTKGYIIQKRGDITNDPTFTRTPRDMVVNAIEMQSDIDISQSRSTSSQVYGKRQHRDRETDPRLAKSFYQHGRLPEKTIRLTDVIDTATATALLDRHIEIFAFRHDVVQADVIYEKAFDLWPGDIARVTVDDGPSSDGTGWDDERCVVIGKTYRKNVVTLDLWRIGT